MNLVGAAGLGLGLGLVTGMPLGVINVAIVDAVVARAPRYATGLGVGGAAADTVHAAIAFAGVGTVVTAHPAWLRTLAVVAAIVIVGYAIVAWRRHQVTREATRHGLGSGVAAGIVLTLPNPGALAAWIAVAASLWPAAAPAEAVALALGVGLGSAVWFTLLGWLVGRVPRKHAALRLLPKLALLMFVGIAIAGVIRAFS